jgi:hypothetical protein
LNAGETDLHVSIELRPAGRFEDLLERTFAVMAEAGGIYDPAKARPILLEYEDEYRLIPEAE